jgi:transposase
LCNPGTGPYASTYVEQLDLAITQGNPQAGPQRQRPQTAPRFKNIDRQQAGWRAFAVDDLIDADHRVRAVWDFLEQKVDLSPFAEGVQAVEGWAGQAAFSPQLLIALWLYAYSEGIGSAREVSRRCESDPAFRWLCGDDAVNYHTLSDFRVKHEKALRGLMVETLAALSFAGLVKLERVAHDGTKVRAVASDSSMHRQGTLEQHLAAATEQVQEVERESETEGVSERARAARRRAAEQREQRLQAAAEQLREIQKQKQTAEEKAEARVSETEPEARRMKMPEGYFAPAYNAQVTTDAEAGIVVNAELSSIGSDFQQLGPALEQVKETFGKLPDQTLVDGGFLSRESILEQDGRTDLIGPYNQDNCYGEAQRKRQGVAEEFAAKLFVFDVAQNRFVCPAGKPLMPGRTLHHQTHTQYEYRAAVADCQACAHQSKCCPKVKSRTVWRIEEQEAVKRFLEKMQTAEAKQVYRQRSQLAEFTFCWLKEKIRLRRFHVRGLNKARMELWWATLAYNIQQWARLRWRKPTEMAA